MGFIIKSVDSGRVAGRTTVGAPLILVAEPFAYVFEDNEHGQAGVIAANLTASFGEHCVVLPA